jgi:hypothetical protein
MKARRKKDRPSAKWAAQKLTKSTVAIRAHDVVFVNVVSLPIGGEKHEHGG